MNAYIQLAIDTVKDIQKEYGKCKQSGSMKKQMVIAIFRTRLNQLDNDEDRQEHKILKYFIDHVLEPLIDSIVFLAKNKEITKLFKNSCSCF